MFLFITSCHFIDLVQQTPLKMYTQTFPTRGCSHIFPSPVVPLHRSGRVNVWISPCCPSRGAIHTAKSTTQSWPLQPIAVFLLSCRFKPRSYLYHFPRILGGGGLAGDFRPRLSEIWHLNPKRLGHLPILIPPFIFFHFLSSCPLCMRCATRGAMRFYSSNGDEGPPVAGPTLSFFICVM